MNYKNTRKNKRILAARDMVPINKSKETNLTASKFSPSGFTLTFAIEVVGLDVWHDCNDGWLDIGQPVQGFKLSYQLYPGQTFQVNVMIWPHVAKVLCGSNYGWVRTWQFLERRWLSFSIRHAFPVRVLELREFVAKVTPNSGIEATDSNFSAKVSSSKIVHATELYLPPLQFGERRQFANVVEAETPLKKHIENMIWSLVVGVIPISVMDGPFNIPHPVKDIRHQDAALCQVRDVILNRRVEEEEEEDEEEEVEEKENREEVQQTRKGANILVKGKKPDDENKDGMKLSGDWILAGIGRVTPFVRTEKFSTEFGEVIALISSVNLPAQDDFPTFFVNVCNLTDVPIEHLKQNRFTHIYTSWTIGEEERNSEQQSLETNQPKTEINFNDHHSVPLSSPVASDVMASFLDEPFRIELRGIRIAPPPIMKNNFFGYEKGDRDFGTSVPPPIPNQDIDILIAHTRIDARALTKINGFVKGEFPLYPPQTPVVPLDREERCTNDINAIRAKVKPDLFIQPGVILEAQMTIEVSMGVVGCKPVTNAERYSRLYCLVSDRDAIMALLCKITKINESIMQTENKAGLLTGFALDTGDTVILFVEGPKEGQILRVWERTADFYPTVKPVFSTSAKYRSRLYPDFLLSATPFNIMKMFAPLSVLLSLAPVYVRPALPLPARSAMLKIGRLIAGKLRSHPSCLEMPTALELKSFKLELCVAPQPILVSELPRIRSVGAWKQRKPSEQNATRVIYKKQKEQK